MKDIKRCCFSGHSAIYNTNIYNRVEPIIEKYMVNHSDYMVCCIQHDYLETVAVYEYAKGKNINIVNITTQYI